jgi:E3 ubiquitin-protein ligase BRE1
VIDDGKKSFADISTELRKTQEALSVANIAIERLRKVGEGKAIPSSQKEAQLQKEVDKCMVRVKHNQVVGCERPDPSHSEPPQVFNMSAEHALGSTCKVHAQCVFILSCAFLSEIKEFVRVAFCKSCIDMRIATRQRKCPACNLQFAQSDAQQLYFQ